MYLNHSVKGHLEMGVLKNSGTFLILASVNTAYFIHVAQVPPQKKTKTIAVLKYNPTLTYRQNVLSLYCAFLKQNINADAIKDIKMVNFIFCPNPHVLFTFPFYSSLNISAPTHSLLYIKSIKVCLMFLKRKIRMIF